MYADPIVPYVFSDKYAESIPYFQIYLLTFIVSSVGCGNILRAAGETRRSLKAYVYTAIIMLPFTYFAIKYYNLNGAIVAATLGAILPKLLLSIFDAKSINTHVRSIYPWRNIFIIFTISIFCIIPFMLLYYYYGVPNFWLALLLISCYLLLAFILQLCFNVFVVNWTDLKFLKKKIFR